LEDNSYALIHANVTDLHINQIREHSKVGLLVHLDDGNDEWRLDARREFSIYYRK
jgi:hypothetical protein